MIAALTGIGLSAAAGLNAYIPFLVVALVARFTDLMELPASMDWISSWWAIGVAGALLLSELVLDKIAVVDHVNDLVASLIRPAVNVTTGGLGTPIVSAAEDTTSFGLSMLAIFLPVLVIVALVVMVAAAFWLWRHVRRLRRGRRPATA